MKRGEKIVAIALVFVVLGAIYLVGQWLAEPTKGEVEIIVVRIHVYDSTHVGVEGFRGHIYIFKKGDAADIHAGGIYWIRFKGRRILAFEKIGDLSGSDPQ